MVLRGELFANAFAKNFFKSVLPYFCGEVTSLVGAIGKKSADELVSEVDLRIQSDFKRFIGGSADVVPRYPVLGEEDGKAWPPESKYAWVIDPLDGTHPFLMGFPNFGVSVFLIEKGVVTFSIIFLPAESLLGRSSIYFAARGGGAWKRTLDDTLELSRLAVSQTHKLSEAIFLLDGPSRHVVRSEFARALSQKTKKTKYPFSAVWGSTRIAAANTLPLPSDLYLNVKSKPWDNLPGALLVEEAGGVAVSPDGTPYSITNYETLLYGNPLIVENALQCCRD